MTDDEIEALAKKHIAPHADRLDAIMKNPVPYQQTEQFRRVKALITDVLRAPVADERVSDDTLWSWAEQIMGGKEAHHVGRDRVLRFARAALASAPVADPTDPGYDADTLREHVRHLERRIRQLSASAPVAITELRIEFTAGGVGYVSIESARAAVLAASNASAHVAGEAVAWLDPNGDPYCNVITAKWKERLANTPSRDNVERDHAAKHTVALTYAAPQASEAVRNAALEQAARAVEAVTWPVGNSAAGELASKWTGEKLREAVEAVRALKSQSAALSAQPGAQSSGNSGELVAHPKQHNDGGAD